MNTGTERVDMLWIVRFHPKSLKSRDFFRVFTQYGMLLTTVQKEKP
jgi:hypothetical protein